MISQTFRHKDQGHSLDLTYTKLLSSQGEHPAPTPVSPINHFHPVFLPQSTLSIPFLSYRHFLPNQTSPQGCFCNRRARGESAVNKSLLLLSLQFPLLSCCPFLPMPRFEGSPFIRNLSSQRQGKRRHLSLTAEPGQQEPWTPTPAVFVGIQTRNLNHVYKKLQLTCFSSLKNKEHFLNTFFNLQLLQQKKISI